MFQKTSEDNTRRTSQNALSTTVATRSPQLPPLLQHKSNISKLTSSASKIKTKNNICRHDSRSEINKFLLTEAEQELILDHPLSYYVDRLIITILDRGKRINQMLLSAKLNADTNFIDNCLKTSRCIRLALYNTYERMYRKGRIGCDLKGINRQIMDQIEISILQAVGKEIKLYQNKQEFSNRRQSLLSQLDNYKRELTSQLQSTKML